MIGSRELFPNLSQVEPIAIQDYDETNGDIPPEYPEWRYGRQLVLTQFAGLCWAIWHAYEGRHPVLQLSVSPITWGPMTVWRPVFMVGIDDPDQIGQIRSAIMHRLPAFAVGGML